MIPQSLQRLAYKPKFGRRPTCHRNKDYTNATTFLLPEYGFIFLRLPHALVVLGLTGFDTQSSSVKLRFTEYLYIRVHNCINMSIALGSHKRPIIPNLTNAWFSSKETSSENHLTRVVHKIFRER
jgi:hypothetical protein